MAEIDIRIFSLNCNGLNDKIKRTAVFNKLKNIDGRGFSAFKKRTARQSSNTNGTKNGVVEISFSLMGIRIPGG